MGIKLSVTQRRKVRRSKRKHKADKGRNGVRLGWGCDINYHRKGERFTSEMKGNSREYGFPPGKVREPCLKKSIWQKAARNLCREKQDVVVC